MAEPELQGNAPRSNWEDRAGPMFKIGLAIGLLLMVGGAISLAFSFTREFLEIFIVCAGLAIILGAFGSTATVKAPLQGITLSGVAALAFAIFWLLLNQMESRYVSIRIPANGQVSQLELIGDDNYIGAYRKNIRAHEFVIFGKKLEAERLRLEGDYSENVHLVFQCIDSSPIRNKLATGKKIYWSIEEKPDPEDDRDAWTLRIAENTRIRQGPCRAPTTEAQGRPGGILNFLLPTAHARQAGSLSADEIGKYIADLDSDIAGVRRNARSELATHGVDIVGLLAPLLLDSEISYRKRLGLLVALTEMLRENKAHRQAVIDQINEDVLNAIVVATVDKDRTIRIYATEFLYDLGDPRTIDPAMDELKSASTSGKYNLLKTIQGTVPYADPRQKQFISSSIEPLKSARTPKTNRLIESIVQSPSM